MNRVVFACVHDAGRSQMASAFFNLLADPSKARAVSAGTNPGERVHPEVVAAMSEVGIDMSGFDLHRCVDDSETICKLTLQPRRGSRGEGRSPLRGSSE